MTARKPQHATMEPPLAAQHSSPQVAARPENMFFPSDWFTSGWMHVLPRHQSMMMATILGTAAAEGMRGSVEDITHVIFGDDFAQVFRGLGDSLDSPVCWLEEGELEDADEAEQQQIKDSAAEHRAACEAAYQGAGVPVPTTIRGLADTMVALGIASQDEDGYWSMPDGLPYPEDVLRLSEEMAAKFERMRCAQRLEPAEQAVIHHLTEDLGFPGEVFTSLDRLAEAVEMDVHEVAAGLDYLTEQGDARLYRGNPRVEVAAKDLPGHARFYLVPDWEHFAENRVHIGDAGRTEEAEGGE
ncbi:MarR family transcriptional regulator OS=Streptomyces alboniger OX=132473 GN=CP975_00015 PE=4 SV=1 [Streptomyces alboniger]